MIPTRGLSHINLNVSDVARSMRFYRELFGMELVHDYEGPIGPHPHGRQAVLSTPGAGGFDRAYLHSGERDWTSRGEPFRFHPDE